MHTKNSTKKKLRCAFLLILREVQCTTSTNGEMNRIQQRQMKGRSEKNEPELVSSWTSDAFSPVKNSILRKNILKVKIIGTKILWSTLSLMDYTNLNLSFSVLWSWSTWLGSILLNSAHFKSRSTNMSTYSAGGVHAVFDNDETVVWLHFSRSLCINWLKENVRTIVMLVTILLCSPWLQKHLVSMSDWGHHLICSEFCYTSFIFCTSKYTFA